MTEEEIDNAIKRGDLTALEELITSFDDDSLTVGQLHPIDICFSKALENHSLDALMMLLNHSKSNSENAEEALVQAVQNADQEMVKALLDHHKTQNPKVAAAMAAASYGPIGHLFQLFIEHPKIYTNIQMIQSLYNSSTPANLDLIFESLLRNPDPKAINVLKNVARSGIKKGDIVIIEKTITKGVLNAEEALIEAFMERALPSIRIIIRDYIKEINCAFLSKLCQLSNPRPIVNYVDILPLLLIAPEKLNFTCLERPTPLYIEILLKGIIVGAHTDNEIDISPIKDLLSRIVAGNPDLISTKKWYDSILYSVQLLSSCKGNVLEIVNFVIDKCGFPLEHVVKYDRSRGIILAKLYDENRNFIKSSLDEVMIARDKICFIEGKERNDAKKITKLLNQIDRHYAEIEPLINTETVAVFQDSRYRNALDNTLLYKTQTIERFIDSQVKEGIRTHSRSTDVLSIGKTALKAVIEKAPCARVRSWARKIDTESANNRAVVRK